MINKIQIQNFKSVVDLSLDLGTFNVLIGENGCGKSNILEAIAFGAAASADKLDYEFLGSRGLRVVNPEFMFSAFTTEVEKVIQISFTKGEILRPFILINSSDNSRKWIDKNSVDLRKTFDDVFRKINKLKQSLNGFKNNVSNNEVDVITVDATQLEDIEKEATYYSQIFQTWDSDNILANYVIYSPEQTSLRRFEETAQIYPLGIKGEGLFQYLKELSTNEKNKKTLIEIKNNLNLIDWFEDFHLSNDLLSNEFALHIKDKYLSKNLQFFDQKSTNEGFLYLLFYSTLFISNITPTFFAIDNIDASLNPKLCMQLTKNLASLAKRHKKQVIVTTQNPAILDGLNLNDDNQRLFVVRRNEEGHTKAQRVMYKAERTMKLSEVWTNGFIGGLPDNF